MFSTKYTSKGTINPAYDSAEKVMKEFVSIAACGSKEQADKVRITRAEIHSNDFYNMNGILVCQPRITASFVSRAIGDFQPEASFEIEFMVSSIKRAVDNDGVELDPAKLEIEGIVPQYGEKVDVIKFIATNPNVIDTLEQNWEAGETHKAVGLLNFSSTTQTVIEELDFGDPIKKQRTINVSEFIIKGGVLAPLEDEFAFALDDIRRAMAERKNRLDAKKNEGVNKKAPVKGQKDKLDLGF